MVGFGMVRPTGSDTHGCGMAAEVDEDDDDEMGPEWDKKG